MQQYSHFPTTELAAEIEFENGLVKNCKTYKIDGSLAEEIVDGNGKIYWYNEETKEEGRIEYRYGQKKED